MPFEPKISDEVTAAFAPSNSGANFFVRQFTPRLLSPPLYYLNFRTQTAKGRTPVPWMRVFIAVCGGCLVWQVALSLFVHVAAVCECCIIPVDWQHGTLQIDMLSLIIASFCLEWSRHFSAPSSILMASSRPFEVIQWWGCDYVLLLALK